MPGLEGAHGDSGRLGRGAARELIEPFTISVGDAVLDDLRERLARTRWPGELRGRGWDEGTELESLTELVAWWRDGYDWRAHEAAVNRLSQFRATVDGVTIHFVHERAAGGGRLPVLLTHGWPSSFYEFHRLIPLLVADGFDVIVPSLPGFAFSAPLEPGGAQRVPTLWARLMTDVLGYERFGAYGGDIGGMVTNRLALEHPELLVGIAVSFLAEPELDDPTDEERALIATRPLGAEAGGAYAHVQRTRPQTLAYALNDSPAGLAAWLLDKWHEWSDRLPDRDELLTNVTLYWVTQTIGSSFRFYADWKLGAGDAGHRFEIVPRGLDASPLAPAERITVPTAIALFSLARWPRSWADRAYADVRRFTKLPRGGHFGALEEPELLADELRAFFGSLA